MCAAFSGRTNRPWSRVSSESNLSGKQDLGSYTSSDFALSNEQGTEAVIHS